MRVSSIRLLVLAHRWLGIALCLFFAMWFVSGAILIYVPFPALADITRIQHGAVIDMSKVTQPPAVAVAAAGLGIIDGLRLVQPDDRPVYVISAPNQQAVAVTADSGERMEGVSHEAAARIGAAFIDGPILSTDGPIDYDQWIVHQKFDAYRPFFRVNVADGAGTVLYVSQRTGDVLQMTQRVQRQWNYFGAVAHWLYPTILRKHWAAWDNGVWWLSLLGLVMAVAGIWLGVQRSAKSIANVRIRSISSFRGWLKWHHLTGLVAGALLLTWMFSGWLSMDHGRLFSVDGATQTRRDSYRGLSLAAAAAQISVHDIAALGPVSQVEIAAVDSQVFLIGNTAETGASFLMSAPAPDANRSTALPDDALLAAVRAAWPDTSILGIADVPQNDGYSRFEDMPMRSMKRIVLGDPAATWIYIDAASGRIVSVMDRSRRLYRWLYYSLHTFDLPGLWERPLLRQGLMLAFLAGGLLLSLTGVVIGSRRLIRSL